MKKIIIPLIIGVLLAFAVTHYALAAEEITKQGLITLKAYEMGGDTADKNTMIVGEEVEFIISSYIDNFFNDTIINANAKIINKSDKTMQVMYMITFYDDLDLLIGGHCANWTLQPKEDINYGSALIKGKEEDFKRVVKYKLYACSYETLPKGK